MPVTAPVSSPTNAAGTRSGILDSAPSMPPGQKTGRSALFTAPAEEESGLGMMAADPVVKTMMATKQVETGFQTLVSLYPESVQLLAPIQGQFREIVMALMSMASNPAALAGAAPMQPPMVPPLQQPGQPGGPGGGVSAGQQQGIGL